MYTGNGLSIGVQFYIEGELELVQVCHRGQCHKAQGISFAEYVCFTAAFYLLNGAELLASFDSESVKDQIYQQVQFAHMQ